MKSKRGERELEKSNFDTTFICLHEVLIENGFLCLGSMKLVVLMFLGSVKYYGQTGK